MKLTFIGDVMLGRLIASKYRQSHYQIVSDNLISQITKSDFIIANLESPILHESIEVADHMRFCGNPDILHQLKWINLFSLANNHINDYGDKGIQDTLLALEHNCIHYTGIYENEYAPYLIESEKIAIITFTDLMNHELSKDSKYKLLRMGDVKIEQTIKKYKELGYFTIIYAHVGMLFTRFPNPITYNYLHKLVDVGANLIVTAHSHCLGGIEYYKDTPIMHSLGDFIMDGSSFRRRRAAYLSCTIVSHQIESLVLTPTITNIALETTLPNDKLGHKLQKSTQKISRKIKKNEKKYTNFYKNQYRIEIINHSFSTLKFILQTEGIKALLHTLFLRIEDVRRIIKWCFKDRSNVQSDTDALKNKTILSEKDIFNHDKN